MVVYQVKVNGFEGEMKIVDLCRTEEEWRMMKVLQLKKKISEKFPLTDGFRMIFTNVGLDDESVLLSDHGIIHMSVIQLVVKVRGGLTAHRERQRPSLSSSSSPRVSAALCHTR